MPGAGIARLMHGVDGRGGSSVRSSGDGILPGGPAEGTVRLMQGVDGRGGRSGRSFHVLLGFVIEAPGSGGGRTGAAARPMPGVVGRGGGGRNSRSLAATASEASSCCL